MKVLSKPLVTRRGEEAEPREIVRRLEAPGRLTFDLASGIPWRISVRAPDHWSPTVIVPPGPDPEPVRFALLPTTPVRGILATPKGEARPDEVKLRFEGAGGDPDALPREEVRCPVENGRWSCRVPVGTLDLRVRAAGFVSHYFWSVELEAGEVLDLGRLGLVKGASMVGRVEVAAAMPPEQRPRVMLEPRRSGLAGPQAESRLGRLGLSETPNHDGFFHFEGVPAGDYMLRATLDGFAPATHMVQIFENAESALNDPLVLRLPVPLEVFVDPPLDPGGEPWLMELAEVGETPGVMKGVHEAPEAADPGYWRKEGLSPGSYMIRVLSSQGVGFAMDRVTLDDTTPPVEIEIPAVRVEGSLFLGDEPLSALLSFGGKHGMVKVEMRPDEEGRFGGVLPRAGVWRVDVEADRPPVFRRLNDVEVIGEPGGRPARAEIHLPGGRVVGEVVQEDGTPRPGVSVQVASVTNREIPSFERTDSEGSFALAGFPPGLYVLTAEAGSAASDPTHTHVTEDGVMRVRLVLREMTEIQGVVVSESGGVPAASVRSTPVLGESIPVGLASVLTDVQGRFDQKLPAWVREVVLTVFPPGFDLTQKQVAVGSDEPVTIPVTQLGGTLALRWQPDPEAELPPVVIGAGGRPWTLSTLDRWTAATAGNLPGFGRKSGRMLVPRMEPGSYAFCWFADLGEYSLARATGRWPTERCERGTLPPFGELSLSVRSPS